MKKTYVLCADVCGKAYYTKRVSGIFAGNVYTSLLAEAQHYATKREATAAMRRLNAGRWQHWLEQVEHADC